MTPPIGPVHTLKTTSVMGVLFFIRCRGLATNKDSGTSLQKLTGVGFTVLSVLRVEITGIIRSCAVMVINPLARLCDEIASSQPAFAINRAVRFVMQANFGDTAAFRAGHLDTGPRNIHYRAAFRAVLNEPGRPTKGRGDGGVFPIYLDQSAFTVVRHD